MDEELKREFEKVDRGFSVFRQDVLCRMKTLEDSYRSMVLRNNSTLSKIEHLLIDGLNIKHSSGGLNGLIDTLIQEITGTVRNEIAANSRAVAKQVIDQKFFEMVRSHAKTCAEAAAEQARTQIEERINSERFEEELMKFANKQLKAAMLKVIASVELSPDAINLVIREALKKQLNGATKQGQSNEPK